MSRSIEVLVTPTGEIKIDAVGFKGADCECERRLKSAAGVTWVTRLGTASGGIFDNMKHVRRYGKLD